MCVRTSNSFHFVVRGKQYVVLPLANVSTLSVALFFYSESDCSADFVVWGAVSFAMSLMLFIVEMCVCITHAFTASPLNVTEAQQACGEVESCASTKTRHGIVLTVGKLAATISEKETHRQFYAHSSEWGHDLRIGDSVSFRMDPKGRMSGKHIVGTRSYHRYHANPPLPNTKHREKRILFSSEKTFTLI